MTRHDTITGWRYDFLTPLGWAPASGVPDYFGENSEPRGWYLREKAVCLATARFAHLIPSHQAPDPDCVCGLHAVTHLTPTVAERIEDLDAQRDAGIDAGTIADDQILVIALSRVRLTDVLPTAWPDDAAALAAHPDAIPDPPHTIRAHRKEYLEVLVDRDWPALPGGWPPEVMPEGGVHYVPDLAQWVRDKADAELDALLDDFLEGTA